jgi:PKD repeat protein
VIIEFNDLIPTNKKSLHGTTTLDLGEYGKHNLILEETILFDSEYTLTIQSEIGVEKSIERSTRTYRGSVEKYPGSVVSLTVGNSFIHGFIRMGNDEINIEPLRFYDDSASRESVLTYLTADQIHEHAMHCGLDKKLEAQFTNQADQVVESKSQLDGCLEVDMAVASDFSMFEFYGSIEEVQNHALAILNAAQSNYDTEFTDEIRFNLVEQFVSTCATCDPWSNTTDSETLLNEFRENSSIWTQTIDQASLWTKRDLVRNNNNAANGLAFVNTVCTEYATLVVEDNDTGQRKRTLFAHELGHNFGASHDDDNTNFIMSTPLVETNEWSAESTQTINRRYLRFACLSSCERSQNVIADFDLQFIGNCAPIQVQFTNQSIGSIDSVRWAFPGGTPSQSTDLEPTVIYNVGGDFDVQLSVFGSNGTVDVKKLSSAINVTQAPDSNYGYTLMADDIVSFTVTNPDPSANYSWEFGDGFTSNATNVSHTFVNTGNVEVTLTASNGCGLNTTTQPIVFNTTPPIANFSSTDIFVCTDQSLQFINESENSESVQWFFQNGSPTSSTDENPVVSFSEPGSYSVALLAINDFARDTIEVSSYISVDPMPIADFDLEQVGDTIQLQFNSQFARGLLWDFGDGNTSDEINPSHIYQNPGTYIVSLIIENFCSSDIQTTEVNILENLPTADFSQSSAVMCEGNSILFTNNSSGALSYQWQFEGGTPSQSTEENPVIVYQTPGVFDVSLTAINEDGETSKVKENAITIIEIPSADFNIDKNENTVSLTIVNSDLSPSWDFGDGNTSTEINPIHTYSQSGQYVITMTVSNDCGSESMQKAVIIETNTITSSFSVSSRNICEGSSTLYNDLTEDADERIWIFEGGIPSQSTEATPNILYLQDGSFDVTLISKNQFSSDTLVLADHIVVGNRPSADFNFVVSDTAVVFTNTSDSFSSVNWTFGDEQGSQEIDPTHIYSTSGTYTVTLTVTNECGSDVIAKNITIDESVTSVAGMTDEGIEFTVENESVCQGQAFILQNNTPEFDSAFWLVNGQDTVQTDTILIQESGVHIITLVVSVDSIEMMTSKELNVIGTPTVDFGAKRTGFDNELEFINKSENATRYLWTFEDRFSSVFENPSHIFAQDTVQTVTLLASNACSSAIINKEFDLRETELPQAIIEVSNTRICSDEMITFESMGSVPSEVTWVLEGVSDFDNSEEIISVEYDDAGVYDVTLIVDNINGSDTVTLEDYITVIETVEVQISSEVNELSVELSATESENGTYFWDLGDGSGASGSSVSYTYPETGTYEITLVYQSECGIQLVQSTVAVEEEQQEEAVILPEASFVQTNTFVNSGGRILFSSTSSETTHVEWFFEGANPSASTAETVIIQYDTAGIFDVVLIAHNEFGSDTLLREDFIRIEDSSLTNNQTESRSLVTPTPLDKEIELQTFPNPFIDNVSVQLNSPSTQTAALSLFSINGTRVFAEEINLTEGANNTTINTANIPSGTYFLSIILREEVIQQKIIKR